MRKKKIKVIYNNKKRKKNITLFHIIEADTQTYIIDNDPVDINKRSFTEIMRRKLNTNITGFQENEKFLSSEIIFFNDDKIQGIGFEDFKFYKIIGRDNNGKIFIGRNPFDNEYYAIKSIDKSFFDISKSSLKKSKNLKF